MPDRVTVMIASPLEPEHVARIAAVDPERVDVLFRPDLMPSPRYVADHGDPDFRRTPAQDAEWRAMLRRADVLFDFSLAEGESPLALSPNLRWVQTTSAGVGPLVARLGLADSDLVVTTASGVHATPLAEFVFAALLHHVKQFGLLAEDQRARRWVRFHGTDLRGKTMAIVGPGRIGREIARLAHAFGMRVWATGRSHDPNRAAALGVDRLFPRDELAAMLAEADCVVVCAPHTPETENLVDRAAIAALKPGVVFVNIGRGALVDEDALVEALREGRIGLAALDVFRQEPPAADSPFWDLPNVIVCPHSASTSDAENRLITDLFVRNLRHWLDGEVDQMSPVLDKQRRY